MSGPDVMLIQLTNINRLILTREQFKGCFDLWFDELRNYISYRCCDTDLATDIVQETFVKVWEKQLEFEGNKTKALLYKIAKTAQFFGIGVIVNSVNKGFATRFFLIVQTHKFGYAFIS